MAEFEAAALQLQPFSSNGDLICFPCGLPIKHADFWVEVRQRDDVDSDLRLAVHVRCLEKL
jgi:hypothetical protein